MLETIIHTRKSHALCSGKTYQKIFQEPELFLGYRRKNSRSLSGQKSSLIDFKSKSNQIVLFIEM